VQLRVPHIDRVDLGSATLDQHLRKASGRRSKIEAGLATHLDPARIEPRNQFQRGARYVATRGVLDGDGIIRAHHRRRLRHWNAVHLHGTAQHGITCARSTLHQATLFERDVEPDSRWS